MQMKTVKKGFFFKKKKRSSGEERATADATKSVVIATEFVVALPRQLYRTELLLLTWSTAVTPLSFSPLPSISFSPLRPPPAPPWFPPLARA